MPLRCPPVRAAPCANRGNAPDESSPLPSADVERSFVDLPYSAAPMISPNSRQPTTREPLT